MKMKRPFSLRRVGKEWNRDNILRFLGYILAAFVINLALECLSRRSLGDGLHYMVTRPWQFFYDSLIILFTLSLSLLFRKRSFCFLLFAAVWIGLGLANCILLGFRATPLTAPDIWLLSSVRDIIEIYMSQPVLILLMLGIAALIGVIVLLWLRAKKTRPSYYFAAVQVLLCGVILAGFTVAFLRSGTLASHFPNLPDAYDSNGFAYCFSAYRTGIDRCFAFCDCSSKAIRRKRSTCSSASRTTCLPTGCARRTSFLCSSSHSLTRII